MAKKKIAHVLPKEAKAVQKLNRKGRDVWRVQSSGRVVEVTTSKASQRAIASAVKRYAGALRRLADR